MGKEWETHTKDRVVKSVGRGEKRRHSHIEELEEHAAFGEIAEGATADKASSGEKGTDLGPDASVRQKPNQAVTNQNCLPTLGGAMGFFSIIIELVVQRGVSVGDMGSEAAAFLRVTAFIVSIMAGGCSATVFANTFKVGM